MIIRDSFFVDKDKIKKRFVVLGCDWSICVPNMFEFQIIVFGIAFTWLRFPRKEKK